MNNTLKDAIILAGKISDMQAKLAALLNCRPNDTGKVIAEYMALESLTTATVTHAGRTYSATYRKGSSDSVVFDSDAAKKLLADAGIELPMKAKKGTTATAIVK